MQCDRGDIELIDTSVYQCLCNIQVAPAAGVAEYFQGDKRDIGRDTGDAYDIDRGTDRAEAP
jgi:hypothetical protein